jgi:hypothetical protein
LTFQSVSLFAYYFVNKDIISTWDSCPLNVAPAALYTSSLASEKSQQHISQQLLPPSSQSPIREDLIYVQESTGILQRVKSFLGYKAVPRSERSKEFFKIDKPLRIPSCLVHPATRNIIIFCWSVLFFYVIWAVILLCVLRKDQMTKHSWALVPKTGDFGSPQVTIRWEGMFPPSGIVWGIALLTILQAPLTFSLHCCEVITQLRTDQLTWMETYSISRNGQMKGYKPPIISALFALKSIPNVVLLIWKITTQLVRIHFLHLLLISYRLAGCLVTR